MAGGAADLLRRHLADAAQAWSIGCLGAIAEFSREPDEPIEVIDLDRLTLATARGAVRLRPADGTAVVAYESLSVRPDRWLHGVTVALPMERAAGVGRTVLTEIGADVQAVRPGDRGALLFDIGVGAANVDAHVRTADAALIRVLRAHCGEVVVGGPHPAMQAILRAHPHRVFCSRLGRIEVFQRIGSKEADPPTPDGPHTHVLPELLRARRTHPATVPVPAGLVPCLTLHPPNPVIDGRGQGMPLDPAALEAFQALLAAYGLPDYLAEKCRAEAALGEGGPPGDYAPPDSRLGRTALRIAIRQHERREGPGPLTGAWRRAFDPTDDRALRADGH